MKKHQFGRQPTKIIWFQVAGFDHEHLAMLRFGFPTASEKTALESSLCIGHAWSYNLYHLRPTPAQSMLSQLTGKKDVTGACSDWKLKPIWSYLIENGYKAGIMEIDAHTGESLLASKSCGEIGNTFLGESIFWSMRAEQVVGADSYLPAVAQEFQIGKNYWDKTCNSSGCGTSLRSSLSSVYEQFAKNSARHLLLVRDFSFKHSIEQKNFLSAREILSEIDKSVESFYQLAMNRDDILVLVSGAGSIDIDFPAEGKAWQKFDLNGREALARSGELSASVFAQGARAENFCGIFEESQIFERMLSGPKQQGLELKIINPFN